MKRINISVVGLSGTEKDKGQMGVGKSCLCNRFIRPTSDTYFIDHISVLSQSDFSGRIVNNDHFLYWGEVKKSTEDGMQYNFSIVEQTEFIDDSTFQPFKVGKMDPYTKRCTSTKVVSAEKLMYVCKNQLGLEREYEQKLLPDGRLSIDGFLVVFDVSPVPNRSVEKQVEFVNNILLGILKTKKPFLLVTTKNDDANDSYVREAEKLCQRKDFKGTIQLVETSAHESTNTDIPFLLLAQLIDKTKNRVKIVSYFEASKVRKDLLDTRTEAVTRLIRDQITDYHTLWSSGSKILGQYQEWLEFLDLFGNEAGQRIFRRHMKKLRDEHLDRRLKQYLDGFSCALQDLLPDLHKIDFEMNEEWNSARSYLRNHEKFDQYFSDCPTAQWTDLSDGSDVENEFLIPFDVLNTPGAESVFRNHLNALQHDRKKLEWRKQFKSLLEETGYVTPGKLLTEVRVLFMGRECFEALSEFDCQAIYDEHQKEITEKSKELFIELLLERVDIFSHFKNHEISGFFSSEDIKAILNVLQQDLRCKTLDRLDQERKMLLLQHLRFIYCPIRENCSFFPNCVDLIIERSLAQKKSSLQSSKQMADESSETVLNLLFMGAEHLVSGIVDDIRLYGGCHGKFLYEKTTYALNYRILNGDINSYEILDFESNGLICVYSDRQSLEIIKEGLERSLICNLELEYKIENLHIVMVYQPDEIRENETDYFRTEGLRLSGILHGDFIDLTKLCCQRETLQRTYAHEILRKITASLQAEGVKALTSDADKTSKPDLRVVLSMFCGDLFSPENIINPLVEESRSIVVKEHSLLVDTFLGETKKQVEIILSSYHGVSQYLKEFVHGQVFFYSTKRKCSLANLSAIAMNAAKVPMQIVAITESGGANAFFDNDLSQLLITEGNSIADRYKANFMTSSAREPLKFAFYMPFLKKIWDRKKEIETLHIEENVCVDNIKGISQHSTHYIPKPQKRQKNYLLRNKLSIYDSECINYDIIPTSSLNFLNGDKEISVADSQDDFRKDKTCPSQQGFQIYPPPATPPEPAPPDHNLVALHIFKGDLVSTSQSSLDEINSDISDSKGSLNIRDLGWLDDTTSNYGKENYETERRDHKQAVWNDFSKPNQHAFTTGRRHNDSYVSNKIRPKGPSQTLKQPGKLNLKNFQLVSEAVARLNMNSESKNVEAALGDSDETIEYSHLTRVDHNKLGNELLQSQPQEFMTTKLKTRLRRDKEQRSESDSSSSEAKATDGFHKIYKKPQTCKKTKKKRVGIPVQPPKIPLFATFVVPPMIETHVKQKNVENDKIKSIEFPDDEKVLNKIQDSSMFVKTKLTIDNETDKFILLKTKLKSWRDDEKCEKRKAKEGSIRGHKTCENEREQDKKTKRKTKQITKGSTTIENLERALLSLPKFMQIEKDNVPNFLLKCINFIEKEGLDSEGIYRVPGNRVHVDLLFQKFEEDPNILFEDLDVPINAVATALKEFFSKLLPPLFDKEVLLELKTITDPHLSKDAKNDKSSKLLALRNLLTKLPPLNLSVLKCIFQHFVRVSENSKFNSMDSKNLAICWWPTLIPIEFMDMGHFEQLRPHLEDIVQEMIDQFPYLFCGEDAFVMV